MPTPQQTIRAEFNKVNTGLNASGADQATQVIIETLKTSPAAKAAVLRIPELERQEKQLWARYQKSGERTVMRNDDGIITSVGFARTTSGGGIERDSMSPADIASLNQIERDLPMANAALRGEIMAQAHLQIRHDALHTDWNVGDSAYRMTRDMGVRGIINKQFLRDVASQRDAALEKPQPDVSTSANAPANPIENIRNTLSSTGVQLTAASPTGDTSLMDGTNPNTGGRRTSTNGVVPT